MKLDTCDTLISQSPHSHPKLVNRQFFKGHSKNNTADTPPNSTHIQYDKHTHTEMYTAMNGFTRPATTHYRRLQTIINERRCLRGTNRRHTKPPTHPLPDGIPPKVDENASREDHGDFFIVQNEYIATEMSLPFALSNCVRFAK